MPIEEMQSRANKLAAALKELSLKVELIEGESVPGGGAAPEQTLPTILVCLQSTAGNSAESLQRCLRLGRPPVVVRCENERVLLDLRTVSPSEDEVVFSCLRSALEGDES